MAGPEPGAAVTLFEQHGRLLTLWLPNFLSSVVMSRVSLLVQRVLCLLSARGITYLVVGGSSMLQIHLSRETAVSMRRGPRVPAP
jgi:hypothetical protein